MKYTYIICMALSSFFTYKLASANTNTYLNAFFIPTSAFQQNTHTTDIEQMKPRHTAPVSAPSQQDTAGTPQKAKPAAVATSQTPQKQTAKTSNPSNKTADKPEVKRLSEAPKEISNTPKKKSVSKYTLDDTLSDTSKPTSQPQEISMSAKEDFEEKSIGELLDNLPSPDFTRPKYQQIYALYGLELRSTYRRGKLPANYEQEQSLSKANSIRRFEVK